MNEKNLPLPLVSDKASRRKNYGGIRFQILSFWGKVKWPKKDLSLLMGGAGSSY